MNIDYKHRIFGLDVIRAAAILLVLFSHSTLLLLLYPKSTNIVLSTIRFFGAIGVDIFFILSGFLIGGIILKQLNQQKTEFKDFVCFWIRRWFKTLPNYFLVLSLNILVFYFFNQEIIDGISKFFFFLHNFNNPMPEFFTESWSLSIEEFAYILVPVLLYALISLLNNIPKNRIFLLVTVVVIILVFFMRLLFHFNQEIDTYIAWSHQIRKVVVYRIDSVYYGFLGAYVLNVFPNVWERYKSKAFFLGAFIFIGMHGVIFLLNLEAQIAPLFFTVFYLPFLSISLLLLLPVFSSWKERGLLKKHVTFISMISYALYLLNYSLVLLPMQQLLNVQAFSIVEKLTTLLVYWGGSFFFAYILYQYFEKPIMNIRDSSFIRKRFCK